MSFLQELKFRSVTNSHKMPQKKFNVVRKYTLDDKENLEPYKYYDQLKIRPIYNYSESVSENNYTLHI